MRWIVGLNSLRGIAIILIVGYHLFRGVVPGGFVAVEMFFGISGFLIASKLLGEYYGGGIGYGRFVWTRLKRIFPMLLLCVLVVLSLGNVVDGDMMTGARENTLGALTFSTNVLEIVRGGSYEAKLIPNVFGHTWFLAIEMQFYLLFPILLLLVLPLFKRRRTALRVVAVGCFGLAAVSMGLMVVYGVGFGAFDRAYFGLDTHVAALMLGAGIGAVYMLKLRRLKVPRWVAVVGGLAALLGVVVISVLVGFGDKMAFGLGLPLAAVFAAMMVVSVLGLQKSSRRPRLLIRVLEWLGSMSFGLYLFHFPLFLLMPFLLPGMQEWVYPVLTIAISLVLAVLTHKFVETGRVFKWFRRRTVVKFAAAVVAAVLLVFLPINTLMNAPEQSSIAEQLQYEEEKGSEMELEGEGEIDFGGAEKFVVGMKEVVLPYFAAAAALAPKPPSTGSSTPSGNYVGDASVLIIGDSVTLGAKSVLQGAIRGAYVDAKESRFISSAAGILASYKSRGALPKVIVISLVTNAYNITDQLLRNIVSVAGAGHDFVFVTGYAGPNQPRDKQNAVIKNFAAANANVYVADWCEVARGNWGLMYADHIHLQPSGRTAYANLIAQVVGGIGR